MLALQRATQPALPGPHPQLRCKRGPGKPRAALHLKASSRTGLPARPLSRFRSDSILQSMPSCFPSRESLEMCKIMQCCPELLTADTKGKTIFEKEQPSMKTQAKYSPSPGPGHSIPVPRAAEGSSRAPNGAPSSFPGALEARGSLHCTQMSKCIQMPFIYAHMCVCIKESYSPERQSHSEEEREGSPQ